MREKIIYILIFITIIYLFLCLIFITHILNITTSPKLILNGKETIVLNVNEEYKELGWKINNQSKGTDVYTRSNVNSSKLGTYKVKYYLENKLVKIRKVIVEDNTKPDIVLKEGIINLYINAKYYEFGFNAIDNYDGDITNKVSILNSVDTSKLGTYYVTYNVSDSSGNKATVKRQVNVINPVISSGVPIIMYHFFYDSSKGEKPRKVDIAYSMDASRFSSEMQYLVDNNYYFPSWEELEQYIDGNISLPEKSIIVTIDDGNESFFRVAYPILKEYGIRATLFVITSWIPLANYPFVDRNLIDYESHTDNMHIGGCKTKHGGIFQCIDYDKAYEDLMKSVKVVGNNEVFAYPFGDYNDRAIELLKKVGFKMALTIENGKVKEGANKYLLPRIGPSDTLSLDDFINIIK